MKQETIKVPVSTILQYYDDVCDDWKERLERDFPSVFKHNIKHGTKLKHNTTGVEVVCIILDDDLRFLDLKTYSPLNDYVEIYNNTPRLSEINEALCHEPLSNWTII
jgi:hypothetical protein